MELQGETALLKVELWGALLGLGISRELEKLWWDMSYIQFNDVFSGSREDCTYSNAINILEDVAKEAGVAALPG